MGRTVVWKQVKHQAGQVTVLIALAMVVMLGLAAVVVDGELLFVTRQRLQDVADMAALAAAKAMVENGRDDVISVVERTVAANFPGAAVVTSTAGGQCQSGGDHEEWENENEDTHDGNHPYTVQVFVCESDTQVSVTLTRADVGFVFAGLFGQQKATVSATATAKADVPGSVSGKNVHIVPWGIRWNDQWQFGQPVTLKGCDGGENGCDGPGNFGALQLNDPGGRDYRDMISRGYSGTLNVGEFVPTDPGQDVGNTKKGLDDLLDEPASQECVRANVQDAVFVVAPVVKSAAGPGKTEVKIQGFAGFCLDKGMQVDGKNVVGTFVAGFIPGESTNDNGSDYYGLWVVHLVPNPQ